MDPDKVSSAAGHLKKALAEIRALANGFSTPGDIDSHGELFASQHALYSMLKLESLAIQNQLAELEAKVLKLKE